MQKLSMSVYTMSLHCGDSGGGAAPLSLLPTLGSYPSSLLETLHRSLATQLNAIFILVAILFFGGVTIRQFVAILLVGLISGTYSSLFTAVPLLVVWEKGELGKLFRRGPAAA